MTSCNKNTSLSTLREISFRNLGFLTLGLLILNLLTYPIAVHAQAIIVEEKVHSTTQNAVLKSVNDKMQQATVAFLESLDETQRRQTTFNFDSKHRTDWHFIPKERVGLTFKAMKLEQRRAARALMRAALSEKGYLKAVTVMSLERVLRIMEAGRKGVNNIRNPEKYWFAVFGDPAKGKPWGWRVEGHHLSLNFTSIDGFVSGSTPIFYGSNPAEVRVGPRIGLRVLGSEIDQARALMATFSNQQKLKAIVSATAPNDVLTLPGKPIDIGPPTGISAADMTVVQQEILLQMVSSFLGHLQSALAEKELQSIKKSELEGIHFAWAGSEDPKKNHYFRVQGKTFIYEYDNSQGNHAHVVWHSTENDFGDSVLKRHYQESPHHQVDHDKTNPVPSAEDNRP